MTFRTTRATSAAAAADAADAGTIFLDAIFFKAYVYRKQFELRRLKCLLSMQGTDTHKKGGIYVLIRQIFSLTS